MTFTAKSYSMMTAQDNSFPLVMAHLAVSELALTTFLQNQKGKRLEANWCADIAL
jgi:hypothetical protein